MFFSQGLYDTLIFFCFLRKKVFVTGKLYSNNCMENKSKQIQLNNKDGKESMEKVRGVRLNFAKTGLL